MPFRKWIGRHYATYHEVELPDSPCGRCGMGGGPRFLYRTERTSRSGGTGFCQERPGGKTEYTPVEVDYVRSYLPVPEMEPEAINKPPN